MFKNKKENNIYNIIINNLIGSTLIMFFVTKSIHRINIIWYALIIIIVIGILNFIKEKIYLYLIMFIYLINFSLFTNNYYNKYNSRLNSLNSNGYYECLNYIKNNKIKYNKLYISDTINLPYITYLYVFEVNANYYLKNRKIKKINEEFQEITQIGNVHFKEPKKKKKGNIYIITKYRTNYLNNINKKCFDNYCVVKIKNM